MSQSPYSGPALRASIAQFLSGKAASALLTFVLLLWLVRLLPVRDYGAYVTFVAALELGALIANLGLPWLAARYLPEYRLHAIGRRLQAFTWWIVCCLAAVQLAWALLLALALDPLLELVGLAAYREVAVLYLGVLVAEGVARQLRDDVLGPLMQQKSARAALVVRQAAMLLLIAGWAFGTGVNLRDVVLAELAASIVGLLIALIGLARCLAGMRSLPGSTAWQEPPRAQMLATAGPMYGVCLLAMLHGPQLFLMIIQRVLGPEAAAAFGFMRNLYEQALRYLPASLLVGLVRPKLIAAYVAGGGAEAVARNANLAGKLSLFVLMPLISFAAVFGESLIGLLSGGKFPATGHVFFGFLLVLIPLSQRSLMEAVAVTTGHSALCMRAAVSGLLMLPLMYGLLLLGGGIWSAVVAMIVGQVLFDAIVLRGLFTRTGYAPDLLGLTRMLISASAAGLVTELMAFALPVQVAGWCRLLLGGAVSTLAFLIFARLMRPFSATERGRLNGFFGKQVFVW